MKPWSAGSKIMIYLNYQIVISGGYSSKAGWLKDVQMLQSYDPDCTSVSFKNKLNYKHIFTDLI